MMVPVAQAIGVVGQADETGEEALDRAPNPLVTGPSPVMDNFMNRDVQGEAHEGGSEE